MENDPTIVSDLIERNRSSLKALKRDIQSKSGLELFDVILEDIQQLKKNMSDPRNSAVFLTAMDASSSIHET